VFLLACGVQGPTRPPRIQQPQRVTDLSVVQVARTLQVSFTIPRLATDGERLTKPLEVQILRATVPTGGPSPSPLEDLRPWQSLASADVKRQTRGTTLALTVNLTADESRAPRQSALVFGVRTLTRGFRRRPVESEISNVVQLPLLEIPSTVQGVQVVTTEKAIELRWMAPAQEPSAYRVYRSSTGKPGSFVLIAESARTQYNDAEFAFGRTYFYKVTAIVKEGTAVAASEDSRVVEIIPRDTFPPAPPQGLTALYTTHAVELIWHANTEPDLGGYNVYRREEGAAEIKLNSPPLETPVFRDESVAAGRKYIYRVTALDLTHNESPPSEEVPAETPAM
jgi:hypothetical protein